MIRVHNIYVSHSWCEADTYDKLVRVLQSDPQFPYRLFGLPKHDPVHASTVGYELRAAIRHPLSQCHVLVVQTGVYGKFGKWITEELELATAGYELRRRVLAIDVFAPETKSTPVQARADRVIGWSRTGIIGAICELAAMPQVPVPSHASDIAAGVVQPPRAKISGVIARKRFPLPASTQPALPGSRGTFGRAHSPADRG